MSMVDLLTKYRHLRAKRSAWRRDRDVVLAMRKRLAKARRKLPKSCCNSIDRYINQHEAFTRHTESLRQDYIHLAQDSASLRAIFDNLTRIT